MTVKVWGGGQLARGSGVRSEGLSLQLSRRVNVVLIVVAAPAPALSLPLPPVCYFMPKTLTATAKSGRQWA